MPTTFPLPTQVVQERRPSYVVPEPSGPFDTSVPSGPIQILPQGSKAGAMHGVDMVEEELTRQQMLNLLMRGQHGQGPLASSTTTFRVELPRGQLDRSGSIFTTQNVDEPLPSAVEHTGTIFGPEQIDLASPAVAAASARAFTRQAGQGSSSLADHPVTVKSKSSRLSQSTTIASRDDRRREIESGKI